MSVHNNGPRDTLTATYGPMYVVFPRMASTPVVYYEGNPTNLRRVLYDTYDGLANSGQVPGQQDRNHVMKVWTPQGLKPMIPNPSEGRQFPSFASYKAHLVDIAATQSRRTAGFHVTLDEGYPTDYRIQLAGHEYNVHIKFPNPFREMLEEQGIWIMPASMSAKIKPQHIRFKNNAPYTEWQTLSDSGFCFNRFHVNEEHSSRIHVRYKIKTQEGGPFKPKLALEAIITPPGAAPNGLTDEQRAFLNTSSLKTIPIWEPSDTFTWDITYPTLRGIFTLATPIPAYSDIKGPHTVPSEWTMRRIVNDLRWKTQNGDNHRTYNQMINYFNNPNRLYYHTPPPTLIAPEIPPHTVEFFQNNPARELPGDDKGPYDDSDYHPGPKNHPAFGSFPLGFETPLTASSTPSSSQSSGSGSSQGSGSGGSQNTNTEPKEKKTRKRKKTTETEEPPMKIVKEEKPKIEKKRKPNLGKSNKTHGITVTARGKYQTIKPNENLTQHFKETVPDMEEGGAEILANLTQSSIAQNTARCQNSIQRTIQTLFPNRPDMFRNTKPKDQLAIITKLVKAGYRQKTIIAYMANYKRIVINNGGETHPDPPELKHVMKGLQNQNHNPAAQIAYPTRKAYSLEALQLVGIRGMELVKKHKNWSPHKVALYQAVLFTLFFGRMRSAEALAKKSGEYDLLTDLLLSDVVFTKDKNGKTTHVTLHLRQAKFQEKTGALVVIPALKKKPYCAVRALKRYIKLRRLRTKDKETPLFLTEHLWTQGASKPDYTQPGLLTHSRFRKDTEAVVKQITKAHPETADLFLYLVTHSLRGGISTELQKDISLPDTIRLELGRWHSTAAANYAKDLHTANRTAFVMMDSMVKTMLQGPDTSATYAIPEK